MNESNRQAGAVNGALVAIILLTIVALGLGGLSIWAFVNYNDQKNNVDSKIAVAVTTAKNQQKADDEKDFIEREKQPYETFTAPSDFGAASIDYPKTWSVYIGEAGNDYEVYLHPQAVPRVTSEQPYAARLSVVSEDYEDVLNDYASAVKRGDLKSVPVEVNGQKGNRLDGTFKEGIVGSMVIFKVRDKTLQLYTQSKDFQSDFDNILLKSLKFNP